MLYLFRGTGSLITHIRDTSLDIRTKRYDTYVQYFMYFFWIILSCVNSCLFHRQNACQFLDVRHTDSQVILAERFYVSTYNIFLIPARSNWAL